MFTKKINMKVLILISGILFTSFTGFSLETDTLGTAGDDLDLYAVMELFKDSESVEDFENKLNSEKNEVNNLDINQDGNVDYIRVIDYADANSHSLTLQVPFSESEDQDIAVIEIEQTDDETTVVQIVGDEDLYGEDYIVEPNSGEDSFKDQTDNNTQVINAYKWKPIRYIYAPSYVVWVSPWRYNHYPRMYRPWRPVVWSVYFGRVHRHHVHYRRVRHHRCHNAHRYYYKHRRHSNTFHAHHKSHHNKHHHKGHGVKHGGKKGNKGVHKKKTNMNSPAPKSNAGKPTKRPGGTVKKSGGKKPKGGKH